VNRVVTTDKELSAIGAFLCALTLGFYWVESIGFIMPTYEEFGSFSIVGLPFAASFIIAGLTAILVMRFAREKGVKWLIIPMAIITGLVNVIHIELFRSVSSFLVLSVPIGGILAFIVSYTLQYQGSISAIFGLSFGILLFTVIEANVEQIVYLRISELLFIFIIIGSLLWALGTKFTRLKGTTIPELGQSSFYLRPSYTQLVYYIPSFFLGILIGSIFAVNDLVFLGIMMFAGNGIALIKPLKNDPRIIQFLGLVIMGLAGLLAGVSNIPFSIENAIYGLGIGLLLSFIFGIYPRISYILNPRLHWLLTAGCLLLLTIGMTTGRAVTLISLFDNFSLETLVNLRMVTGGICLLSGILPWVLLSKNTVSLKTLN